MSLAKRPIFISGISPGPTGTGRLLEFLALRSKTQGDRVEFLFGPLGLPSHRAEFQRGRWLNAGKIVWNKIAGKLRWFFFPVILKFLGNGRPLVLFHFQSIGFAKIDQLLESHQGKIYAYLVDNNFFCLRSYNYIPGAQNSCLACLGKDFSAAKENHCSSLPFPEPDAVNFLERFRHHVRLGKVAILTQNRAQERLARLHFGEEARIHLVGDWMSDWENEPEAPKAHASSNANVFDVVFHGSAEAAKGAIWALELAKELPARSFLFPFPRHALPQGLSPSRNAHFQPMTWATGLGDHCQKAQAVLVPSLWSAPVEGALLKSIRWGNLTVVVDIEGAFSGEISDDLLLRLPANPKLAAGSLEARLASRWKPEEKSRRTWFEAYRRENIRVLERIMEVMER